MSDFGLISFFTANTNSICRYNVCYNAYSPIGDARGIFGDDGCRNLNTYGNLTFNNKTYGVDVRYVSSVTNSNYGNILKNNIILDRYRFEGSGDSSPYVTPITNNNLYITKVVNDVDVVGVDTYATQYNYSDNYVYINQDIAFDLPQFIRAFIK